MEINKNQLTPPPATYDIVGLTQEEAEALRDFIAGRHHCYKHILVCAMAGPLRDAVGHVNPKSVYYAP